MKEEAHRLEVAAQKMETKGLEKVEVAVAGLEAEGLYRLLRGVMSHPSVSSAPPPPRKLTISHPPLSPICPPGVCRTQSLWPHSRHSQAGIGSCFQLPFQLQRKLSPLICSPFAFSWGASSECINSWFRAAKRVHQPHMLPFVHMCLRCT